LPLPFQRCSAWILRSLAAAAGTKEGLIHEDQRHVIPWVDQEIFQSLEECDGRLQRHPDPGFDTPRTVIESLDGAHTGVTPLAGGPLEEAIEIDRPQPPWELGDVEG
jgi:hypothetical protein